MTKPAAYQFFTSLHQKLEAQLPIPSAVRDLVDAIKRKPKEQRTEGEKVACGENNMLYLGLPIIFDHVKNVGDLDDAEARKIIGCEYFDKYPEYASGNCFRKRGHPFGKNIAAPVEEVLEKWRKPYKASYPANQAFPDLCLSSPFDFPTIFEGKYFTTNSSGSAEKALVQGVREIVHYRGLPWDYEYGCLLAYDASLGAHLKNAWDTVAAKQLFWDDANIFVMVVRGQNKNAVTIPEVDTAN